MSDVEPEERAERALALAKAVTDRAEVYLAENNLLTIRMANNVVIESKGILDTGVGIRIIIDGGIGFSSTSDLSDKGLEKAIEDAEAMARHREIGFEYDFPAPGEASAVTIYDRGTAQLMEDLDSATDYAHRMIVASSESSPKVVDNAGIVNFLKFKKLVLNTNGVDISEEGTGWSAFLTATAEEGPERREGMVCRSTIRASDFDPELMGEESAEMAVRSLGGEKIDEGDYELILLPSAAQCVVTELANCTNPVIQERSIPLLRDRLGEKIASSLFSLRMNPRRTGFSTVGAYDDEGVPTEELTLFEEGVYKASPYDSWYAQRDGVEGTGSGFRGASMFDGGTIYHGKMYHTEPAPRVVSLEMEAGPHALEEMIESTGDGVMVGVIWYSRIMVPTRGDYNGICRMGTMRIKNGEVVGAIQKCRLVDNILGLAAHIEMAGEPVELSHWHMPYSAISPVKISKAHLMPYYD